MSTLDKIVNNSVYGSNAGHTMEELYQGVKVGEGRYLVAMRRNPPPRLMTGITEGIHPNLEPPPYRPVLSEEVNAVLYESQAKRRSST